MNVVEKSGENIRTLSDKYGIRKIIPDMVEEE